jgi:predicted RNA-binding protein Jag
MAGHNESIYEGKTLDEAVRMGLDALGLSRAEVMITVMEEGSGGFLGLGARPYRVRVMPRPGGAPREPGERGDRKERGRGGRDRGRAEGRSGGGPRREGGRDGRRGDRERGRNGREPVAAGGPRREERPAGWEDRGDRRESPAPGPAVAREDGERGSRRRRGRRSGRGGGDDRPIAAGAPADPGARREAVAQLPPEEAPAMRESRPAYEPREPRERPGRERRGGRREGQGGEPPASGPVMPAAELEALGIGATERLLAAMGFQARVSARAEGSGVDVTAQISEGEDLIIGRKGEVRQALQHLLNLTVNRGSGLRYHLQLEINEFWKQREAELENLARTMADEAIAKGGEVLTEYLNAQERRIIHVALRDDSRVRTYGVGDGLIKKLAVVPADSPEGAKQYD